jgi:predicted RNase H-like HicB family nuclease
MKNDKYAIRIVWSDEDMAFIASVFELPGCMADGKTRQEALKNIEIAIADWVETATSLGRGSPEPVTLQEMEEKIHREVEEFHREVEEFRLQIEEEFQKAIKAIEEKFSPPEKWLQGSFRLSRKFLAPPSTPAARTSSSKSKRRDSSSEKVGGWR